MPSGTDDNPINRFHSSIGRVVTSSAFLESMLRELYANLIGYPNGGVLAAGETFDRMKDGCAAVLRVSDGDPLLTLDTALADQIRTSIAAAHRLYQDRNAVVHGVWYGMKSNTETARAYRSRRWQNDLDKRRWTVAQLDRLAKDLRAAALELKDLADQYREATATDAPE